MEQLKAISQNVMHSSVGITDGIYGRLVEDDVHNLITGLSEGIPTKVNEERLLKKILEIVNFDINNISTKSL
jgi:hypothetical protein